MANQGWNSSGSAFDPAHHGHQNAAPSASAAPQGDWGQPEPYAHQPSQSYAPAQSQQGYVQQHAPHPIQQQGQYQAQPHPAQAQAGGWHQQPQPSQQPPQHFTHQQQQQQFTQQQHQQQPHPTAAPSPYYGAATSAGVGGQDPNVTKIINGAGAFLSLALVIGLGVWGYNLAVRDASDVPVVAALEGPMRVQPEDPGGQAADHQGLAVNAVAAGGVAEGPAAQVMLAPGAEELTAADAPVSPRARPAEADEDVLAQRDVRDVSPETLSAISADMGTQGTAAAAQAFVEAITQGTTPLSGEAIDEVTAAQAAQIEQEAAAARIAAVVGEVAQEAAPAQTVRVAGVNVSPVPQRRPAGLVTRASANPASAPLSTADAPASNVAEVAAASIPKGTRLVQLGAFDSQDVARGEWDKLAGRFDEYLEGKKRVIEKAQSGGKTFYRLRAMGFDDVSDARRFCSALMAGKAACIPVVTR